MAIILSSSLLLISFLSIILTIDQQSSNRPKNNCNLTKQRKKEKLPKNNITHNHTLSIDTLHPPPVCTCIHKGARSGAGARLQSYETCAPRGNIASAIRRRSAIRSIEERRQLTVIPAAAASPFHNFPLNRHSTRVFHPLSRVSTLRDAVRAASWRSYDWIRVLRMWRSKLVFLGG